MKSSRSSSTSPLKVSAVPQTAFQARPIHLDGISGCTCDGVNEIPTVLVERNSDLSCAPTGILHCDALDFCKPAVQSETMVVPGNMCFSIMGRSALDLPRPEQGIPASWLCQTLQRPIFLVLADLSGACVSRLQSRQSVQSYLTHRSAHLGFCKEGGETNFI